MWTRPASMPGTAPPMLDVARIRRHFDFPATGRVVTNNAASTQPPRELLALYRSLAPWKYSAGTPNILGVIASAQALRLVLDLVSGERHWFGITLPIPRHTIESAMNVVARHIWAVTERALQAAQDIPGLTVYGPAPGTPRSPLLAFNVTGTDPMQVADGLNQLGVESRAGCHCATLAHHDLGLTPPASCRLSFTLYTSVDDVERAMDALRRVANHARATARG